MSLSRGRDHLATPGPSIIPQQVLNAMHRSAPNIYEGEIIDVTESDVLAREINETLVLSYSAKRSWLELSNSFASLSMWHH